MATNRRDVVLAVRVETDGEQGLSDLAQDLKDIGASAGSSKGDVDRLTAELDQLTAATKAARDAERAQATALADKRKELDAQRDALARMRAEADRATKGTADFQAAERAARVAIVEKRIAVREAAAALAATATTTRAAVTAEARHVAAIQRTAAAARASAATQAAASTTAREAVEGLTDTYRRLQTIAAVAIGGGIFTSLIRDVATTADEYSNLSARIKIATGDGAAFESAMQGVVGVAERTSAALDTTATLFTRITQAGRELKLSQGDALALTETINQAVALEGQSAESSNAAIVQLIQGLQSGVLRGEEFNSVMEQAPRLALALADGLGVGVGALRQMAAQGQLTAQTVIAALSGQSQAVAAEFDKLPPTVGRALQSLGNAWTVYVGQVDQANGISAAAAEAIEGLARNLDTLGTLLFSAGKAAAAYQALKLAQTFFGIATATKAATAETVAYTAAQTAATAATGGSVAAAGRFASLLAGFKVAALLAIVTNFRELGTWIGESAAKLAGYDDKLREVEESQAANERAARAMAASVAALAQESARAAEEAAGLTAESRRLVGEFDQVRGKGESVVDALGKVQKALDLDDLSGIAAAGVALDVLAQRGAITATQLRETLGGALRDVDLGVFEAQARAAFDNSTQGARRLAAALEAVADESLRRVGTSVREIETGFDKATSSAINDVDALAQTLEALGADADTTGRLLAQALDKATDAAGTERALQAVISRVEELGRAGKLSGDTLTAALEVARRKLEELKPGVDSLSEALRAFGLKTRDELQATADKLGSAYRLIAQSVTVSLADKVQAFNTYRDAAIAANGGVESSELKLQARILENQAAAAGLGDVIESSMGKARRATDGASSAQERYNKLLREGAAGITTDGLTGVRGPGDSAGPSVLGPTGSSDFTVNKQVPVPAGYYYSLTPERGSISAGTDAFGQPYGGYFVPIPGYRPPNANAPGAGAFGGYAGSANQRAGIPDPNVKTVRVDLTTNGKPAGSVPTTPEGAAALVAALEEAQRAFGS